MVALDPLLKMLRDVVDGIGRQQPVLDGGSDRAGERSGAVRADRPRRQKRFVLQNFAKEASGGIGIPFGGQEEIDRVPMLVDGAIQISPPAADLDIGLVDPDRTAMGFSKLAQPLLDQRRVGENPTIDRRVIDIEAGFGEYLFNIPVAQRVAQIPS